ncbi:SDR family NAD(P)-dependent oxidoreductase [Nocardioides kongjuensis]|uniref:NAD(P)-dependent dehydrogenase (Short-subunit alcohol dehydrogenase family) n=1 Tax=Nocardioides kongjuensis TaxID=349522 RepID=A0A852RKJ5_9ACTN|nr:NAD(P)-dependent dehydrogenase (short-subunit alcohol dehydrogenase family) [Nocardioides kongjuensis]
MTAPVAVVTGASRGVGRGIALALGDLGATIYVTGRSASVADVAAEVGVRGGHGIGVLCDHGDDAAVAALFSRVGEEQGRLDVLVNNAIALPPGLGDDLPFWERPLAHQAMFDVGLRSTYAASWHAAPLLVTARGLLVNTSSFGGGCYMHGPAYGAAKAGVDRLAHDFGIDLEPHGVTAVSLWMGILRTERTQAALEADPDRYGDLAARTESVELPGRVIAALWQHPERTRWNGQTVVNAELAVELGVTDVDGAQPPSHRSMLGGPPAVNPAIVR